MSKFYSLKDCDHNLSGGKFKFYIVIKFSSADDPPEYNYLYALPLASFVGAYGAASCYDFPDVHHMAYLGASLCCVGALTGLSAQSTSRIGTSCNV